MRFTCLCAAALLAIGGTGVDAVAQQEPTGRLLGLVEIPSVFPRVFPVPGEPEPEPGPVTLRASPSSGADVVAVVENPEQVESREHGYEESSAVVYGYQRAENRTWYGVRLVTGELGWLSDQEAGTFRPLSALFDDALVYTTDAWDGRLFRAAGRPETAISVEGVGPEASIVVASSGRVGTDLYFLVVVLAESICTSSEPGDVVAAGWLPAYAETGAVNLWYYSRGC